MQRQRVKDIREAFKDLFLKEKFVGINREASMTNIVGSRTLEIAPAYFLADEDAIFGKVNWDYVIREKIWYDSQSLNVNDIPGEVPKIWKAVADKDGYINSNYGWCIYSSKNEDQFFNATNELMRNPESRRAVMIYTRPSMWYDYNENGRSDFMCTNTVQYLIRDGAVHAMVQMRSCDAIMGFKNDRAWQQIVLNRVAEQVNFPAGNIYWDAGSLHVYERHFPLVENFAKTGEIYNSKDIK